MNTKVSIIVPAYNEARYLEALLQRILAIPFDKSGFDLEVIVVDDGSTDNTFEIASRFPGISAFRKLPNQGKGRAVQFGIQQATGDYVLVQDADLEYDPEDYLPMLKAIRGRPRLAVYGSRVLGQIMEGDSYLSRIFVGKHPNQDFGPWIAGIVLSLWTLVLYGRWITDTLTAYKIYPREFFDRLDVETNGFETDHELTARLIRQGYRIKEIPIHYEPRTRAEGKKIRARDGLIAIWTLLRFRFA